MERAHRQTAARAIDRVHAERVLEQIGYAVAVAAVSYPRPRDRTAPQLEITSNAAFTFPAPPSTFRLPTSTPIYHG